MEKPFTKQVVEKIWQDFKIDLTKEEYIKIDNMIIPNYCLVHLLNINSFEWEYEIYEFCRIINKIFGFNYEFTKQSYYENDFIKIEKDDVVFDCGANTGIFSLYAANKAKIVYSFEPGTLIRHYLRYTKLFNNNIIIVPFGLSNYSGQQTFIQFDNPAASRLLNLVDEDVKNHRVLYKEQIEVITIDNFVKQTGVIPSFIKIDAEGAELEILQGAKETLKKYSPKCSISIHKNNQNNINYIKSLFPENYIFLTKEEKYYDPLIMCIKEK